MTRLLSLGIIACIVMPLPLHTQAQDGPAATFFQLIDVSNYKGATFTAECWLYADTL